MTEPPPNRWRRYDVWGERPLAGDRFAALDPEHGFAALVSPHDPVASLVIERGRVVELDGVAEPDFDMIDTFIARHHIDAAVAAEAMAVPPVDFARMMVDVAVPRAVLVRRGAWTKIPGIGRNECGRTVMPTMTPWRAVVKALVAEGVDRVFGLPGNPLHLVADLARHAPGIRNVLVRHEHSGVTMAFAHARVTGEPAVCYGNPGPGITNMATALLEATSASLPVVCFANGTPLGADGRGAFQELDAAAHLRPVTKWATRIVDPATTPWVVERAFTMAKQGRPGAVFIDLPSDIALKPTAMAAYHRSGPRLRS
ncbi:MAG: thiamine pyrophosphate-binding protein, partial [Alphaproteobacteria bacterium]